MVLASVFNFNIRSRAIKAGDAHGLKALGIGRQGKDLCRFIFASSFHQLQDGVHHGQLLGVSAHKVHALDGGEAFGSHLPQATGHQNVGRRILMNGPPNGLANLAVGFCRDGAGIDDVSIADLVAGKHAKAPGHKCLGDGFGFILVYLAAKGVDANGWCLIRHERSLIV